MSPHPKFLVTGASGFVGRHLVARLVEQHGADRVTAMVPVHVPPGEGPAIARLRELGVGVLPADLLRLGDARPGAPDFDVLYHLAAYAATEDPKGPFEVNSEGTRRLIEWLGPRLAGSRVVFTGTIGSVDQPRAAGPVSEETPCTPITPYGQTKLEAERILRHEAGRWGYTFTILRLCTIIGPGFRSGGMFGVLPDLLRRQALVSRLNWPGRLSMLEVKDLAGVMTDLPFRSGTENELFTISNGDDLTFDEVLDEMAAVLRLKRRRVALPAFLWRCSRVCAWNAATSPVLPYRLRIAGWRLAYLIGDGLCAESRRLRALLGRTFQPTRAALRSLYGER